MLGQRWHIAIVQQARVGRRCKNMSKPTFKVNQLLGTRQRARGIRNSEGAVNVRQLTRASREASWAFGHSRSLGS